MPRTRPFLFELSGEHPSLPRAEALALMMTECSDFKTIEEGPGYLIVDMPEDSVDRISSRISLTHRIGGYVGTIDTNDIEAISKNDNIPPGSLSVRVHRIGKHNEEIDAMDLTRRMGGALSKDHRIDLGSADVKLRVLISDRIRSFIIEKEIDRRAFEERRVQERPFFSPISLHPRYARALINLTGVRPGERLLDPFCGTGGILIEAASMGIRAFGSDLSEEMMAGCRKNLEHFGYDAEIERADIGDIAEIFPRMRSVATDPPYGRSASTGKEDIIKLYSRGFASIATVLDDRGRAGIVLPCPWERETALTLESMHVQKVHRSLNRYYHIFRPRGP